MSVRLDTVAPRQMLILLAAVSLAPQLAAQENWKLTCDPVPREGQVCNPVSLGGVQTTVPPAGVTLELNKPIVLRQGRHLRVTTPLCPGQRRSPLRTRRVILAVIRALGTCRNTPARPQRPLQADLPIRGHLLVTHLQLAYASWRCGSGRARAIGGARGASPHTVLCYGIEVSIIHARILFFQSFSK